MPDAAKLPLEALLLVSAFSVPKLLFPNPLPPVLLRPVEPKPFHPPVLSFFELPPPKPEKPEKPVFFLPEVGGGAQQKVDFSVQQHLNEGFHVAFPG